MFARILSLIILVPLAVILVVFCVANLESTTLSFDPLGTMPELSFQAPLFLLLMVSLLIGVLLGGIAAWIGQSGHRRNAWRRRYEVDRLNRELEENKAKVRELQLERDRAAAGEGASASNALAAPRTKAA